MVIANDVGLPTRGELIMEGKIVEYKEEMIPDVCGKVGVVPVRRRITRIQV